MVSSRVQSSQESYEDWTDERLYQDATESLKKGHRYNKAITALEVAVRRNPANAEYRLALGCAYAARFTSIAQAVQQAEAARDEYKDKKERWNYAQTDAQSPRFGVAPPAPPLAGITSDDGASLTLTQAEVTQELARLGNKSVAAFDEASKRAARESPERLAELEYTRGWGLFLLRLFGKSVVKDASTSPVSEEKRVVLSGDKSENVYISQTQITDCFRNAVSLAPQNPVYWHSFGLSFAPKYLYMDKSEGNGYTAYEKRRPFHGTEEMASATNALKRALDLEPNRFDLLYQLSLLYSFNDSSKSVAYLEKAATRRGGNALLWYLLAEQKCRQARKESGAPAKSAVRAEALQAIRRGNRAAQFEAILFVPPLPALLKRTWDDEAAFSYGGETRVLMYLDVALFDLIPEQTKEEDDGGALSSAQALMDMGAKVIAWGDGWRETSGPQAREVLTGRIELGSMACFWASIAIKDSQTARPDERKAAFLTQNADFVERLAVINQEVRMAP